MQPAGDARRGASDAPGPAADRSQRMAEPSNSPQRFRAELAHDSGEIHRFAGEVVDAAERAGYTKASRFAVRLAFEEAVSNAFKHGHAGLDRTATVAVEAEVTPESIRMVIEDRGPGFDPGAIADPTLDENLDKPSGRGLMLIRAYMTRVAFNPLGNRIEMLYLRPELP